MYPAVNWKKDEVDKNQRFYSDIYMVGLTKTAENHNQYDCILMFGYTKFQKKKRNWEINRPHTKLMAKKKAFR